MRGDDRPGMKKTEASAPARGGRPGDRRGPPRADDRRFGTGERGERGGRDDWGSASRGPRLGDAAFRAQRDAWEHAQSALRRLAVQAHGESLTQLLQAWAARQAEQMPSAGELGRAVAPSTRAAWTQALASTPSAGGDEPLLRLEMAADVPTPAEQITARRALQLQLLTRRHDPSPAQTWGEDVAKVLATPHDAGRARRLQNVLKVLLRS
jgi:ATP-dependent RNA helicase SUPV3L1/SUV3